MSERHTLPRLGNVPLAFEGDHIAGVSGQRLNGADRNRWHELDLYRTAGGTYVLAIHYHSLWQGEASVSDACTCATPAEVLDTLRGIEPLEHVQGYPPGDTYAEKQRRLEQNLRRDFAQLVTELFSELGDEFAERID